MNCLHYCAFFDSPLVCELLLKQSKVLSCKNILIIYFKKTLMIEMFLVLNQPCSSLKNNTPLHLACGALALSTAQILLQSGASKNIFDDQQRIPIG